MDRDREQASDDEAPGRWGAFSYPLFRRYWFASLARVFGLQFRFIGIGWFVVSSEGLDLSPLWLGYVGLAASLPTIVLSVPFGILADRYEHKTILVRSFGATSARNHSSSLSGVSIANSALTLKIFLKSSSWP